jgi:hypothetical protein
MVTLAVRENTEELPETSFQRVLELRSYRGTQDESQIAAELPSQYRFIAVCMIEIYCPSLTKIRIEALESQKRYSKAVAAAALIQSCARFTFEMLSYIHPILLEYIC